jgi:5-methylcytosine-specific restriction endonuclease McrA
VRNRKPGRAKKGKSVSAAEFVKGIKKTVSSSKTYRDSSLRIHGLICAKCSREFAMKDIHMLTVHHRDGNPNNTPPDGSNWENLCVYCHDDEHSRQLLGDYFSDNT